MHLLLTTWLLACSGAADSLDQPASPPMDRIDQATLDKYTQPIGDRGRPGGAADGASHEAPATFVPAEASAPDASAPSAPGASAGGAATPAPADPGAPLPALDASSPKADGAAPADATTAPPGP
jgi:hypothetical protein